MQISQNDWKNYIDKLRKMSQTAADKLQQWVDINGFDDRDALIEYAHALITKYGEGSASLACDMYDAIADAEGALVPPAIPAATATYGETAKAINGSLLQSTSGQLISDVAYRLVKRTGADTTLQNCRRDGSEFAWVPFGDTCPFCIALASRGWQKISRKSMRKGHAEHIHANCDCQYAVSFGNTDVSGYVPGKYEDMYYGAAGKKPQDKINAMRRQNYAENKDKINAQKREAYAIRTGNEEE